jgi:phosphoenolpyruvate carboxylase
LVDWHRPVHPRGCEDRQPHRVRVDEDCDIFGLAAGRANRRIRLLVKRDELQDANLDLMRDYAALVTDKEIRTRFTKAITAEFDLTQNLLAELFDGSMADRRPRMAKTLGIREAPLKVLHHQQIALLREWRDLIEKDNQTAADALLPKLLLSINAIASGLRTTG